MFSFNIPVRLIGFVFLSFSLISIGPSLGDFTSESIIEYAIFYVSLWVIFYAGVFMKGKANNRYVFLLGVTLVVNHYLFYAFLELSGELIYLKLWVFFVASTPMYLAFTYYTSIQATLLNFFEKIGVSDKTADKIVGPIKSTNLGIMLSCYASFWMVLDFTIAIYSTAYGLYYDVPADGKVTTAFASNNHINIYFLYDSIVILADATLAILLAHRVVKDNKRPDAIGLGRYMTWDKNQSDLKP
ncbi:hypothetical protein KUL42_09770 [Alteromonas sp. KUL42]|uniref:hypothetical protein n=1 Tax=Alteromonas sp. KUL42 TaxID=2480797 RepID=UPI001035CF5B|nr:hypothetical protein [Alteromonas sp. KUL42]TAP37766.1 hypothetical protein EYR97_04855 [Alteromonas sp. KUL42]GEA06216.1 hypothetical protein KUL42_09770 [Alteromonas sp. KUL42]